MGWWRSRASRLRSAAATGLAGAPRPKPSGMTRTGTTASTKRTRGTTSTPLRGTSAPKARPAFRKWRRLSRLPTHDRRLAEAAKGDANDALWAIEAIQDYNPEPDLDKIKAKVLLINDAEDHANPPELGTVERAMKRVKHGRYVLIPAGPNTHGHFSHYYGNLWKPYLVEFMASLDPPQHVAAAE